MRAAAAAIAAELAAAVHDQAVHAGRSTPAVRGADWRLATVQTVNADGTITTTDGIPARRLESYVGAKAGDQVIITVSSIGGWVCWGRPGAGGTSLWTPYTPTFSASGGGAAAGNAVMDAEYLLRGDECHVRISFVAGSSTTFGTGGLRWGIPFTAASLPNANMFWAGSAMCSDAGLAYYPGMCRILGGTNYLVGISPVTAAGSTPTEWRPATPFTWATGDYASFGITYKIA
ncbi:hypothetical protein ACFY40_11680 [Streptomyces sp. NPDC012950]|uniref:hypothetical protein n=1 Tax=Streptomyces sp. NPDC012950 TaxID=3364858 RepID=UPI00368B23A7